MSYLLDKKLKKQKLIKTTIIILVLFCIFYFRTSVFKGLSFTAHTIFRPVVLLGNKVGNSFSNLNFLIHTKKSLISENEILKSKLVENDASMANYNILLDENNKFKEILGRKPIDRNMILAGILEKPNHSLYDVLVIDGGENEGISLGQRVFALGNIPIGYVAEVYANSSKVVLYSSPREITEVVISGRDVFMQLIGRGNGNFEMILPRDFVLDNSAEVSLPGANSFLLAKVATIISDPRDSFQKALLVSPVNIQELKFVEVEK